MEETPGVVYVGRFDTITNRFQIHSRKGKLGKDCVKKKKKTIEKSGKFSRLQHQESGNTIAKSPRKQI